MESRDCPPRERKKPRDGSGLAYPASRGSAPVRLILLLAQGKFYVTIRQVLGCDPNYISRWKGASR